MPRAPRVGLGWPGFGSCGDGLSRGSAALTATALDEALADGTFLAHPTTLD